MNQMMPSKSIFLWKMDFPVSIIFPRAVSRRSHWFASFQLAANICQQINLLCFQNNQTPFYFTPVFSAESGNEFSNVFLHPHKRTSSVFFFFKNNHNYITFIPHFFIVILSSLKLSLKYLKRGKGLRVM